MKVRITKRLKWNLVETIIINIEETKKLGTFEQFLEDSGLEEIIPNILSARVAKQKGLRKSAVNRKIQ